MPSIDENRETWNADQSWSRGGDEWSDPWGGTELMWLGTVLPRIHRFLPAGTVLEIGPGFGRWTQFLVELCDELIAVDLSERCVEACRDRFASVGHAGFHVNDGFSLDAVADGSVDFAFSFDSLVHAEADAVDAYLEQLARKLRPDGVAFIHHSNAGAYRRRSALARRLPPRLRVPLTLRGLVVNTYAWRAASVTAESVAAQCDRVGLAVIGQEKANWIYGRHLIDTMSTLTPRGSRWERPPLIVENRDFAREAAQLVELSKLYGVARFGFEGAPGPALHRGRSGAAARRTGAPAGPS
jgi:SAM-dependent methyltransferase